MSDPQAQTIDYDALAKQAGATSSAAPSAIDYDALAKQAGATKSTAPAAVSPPSFWDDPKAFLVHRAKQMGDKAQELNNLAEDENIWKNGKVVGQRSLIKRLGYAFLSDVPATAQLVDKAASGLIGNDRETWTNAAAVAAGAVDPAIPAAYFGAQGTEQLTGLKPGVNPGDVSPDNVQNALLAGATVTGAATAAGSPKSGAVSRAMTSPVKTAGRVALMGRTPAGAYESALKPSTTLSPEERASVVQTGLSEGIPVSTTGVKNLSALIDDLNDQIKETIASDPDRPINPAKAAQNVAGTRTKFQTQVNPKADLEAIDASKQEFLDQFRSKPGGAVRDLTADEAQAMKQGTYRVLGGKYGEQGSASVEAQKALARGLKEELVVQFPELKDLNAREGSALDLKPVLERAVARGANHQMFGLGTPVVAGAAKALTGSSTVATVAGVLKAVLDDPVVKSRLAIAMSRRGVPYQQALARVASYQEQLGSAGAALLPPSSARPPDDPTTQPPQ